MPFTPIHLGPGAAFKAIGGRHFSFIGIIQNKPILHGYTHTLVGALLIGFVAGVIGRPISAFVLKLLQIKHRPFTWDASFSGAFVGTFSHMGARSMSTSVPSLSNARDRCPSLKRS